MEPANPRPVKIRKRANKACLACRARKVRCDVSQRGRPCMNCFLDSETCVVVGRASRRRKSTEDDANGGEGVHDEAGGAEHLHERASGESRAEGVDELADGGHFLNDGASDAGSYEREASRYPHAGFSAVNAPSGRLGAQALETSSPFAAANRVPKYGAPQAPHLSTKARTQQLQWPGEQSMIFGVDVMYSYYPFLEVNNLQSVLPQDVSYLEMQGCFRVPTKTVLDDFVKQYFLHVHPLQPVLNEGDFWEMYGSPSADAAFSTKLSLLLFQAMLYASCAYVPRHRIRALGYPDAKTARAALYRRAKLLFDFEVESDPIAISQAALLLSSWSPSGSHSAQAGSFWLGVAIHQAKMVGAHHYTTLYGGFAESQPLAALKRRNTLKRLWWCIILSDRILCLATWKPLQVSRLHLHPDLDSRRHFQLADFMDEIERSRVYNSSAKRALIDVFIKMADLAAILTECLCEALPLDEGPHWDHRFSGQEKERIEECKNKLASWYDEASWRLPLPARRPLESAGGGLGPEPPAGQAHESVVLYTNYLCLIYQTAMTRLCNYECLRMVAQVRRLDETGTALPEKKELEEKHSDIRNAAFGVVLCLKKLTKDRLSRWLPLNSFSCVSLPLIMSIADAKLSRQPGPRADLLQGLHESVRAYQPQLDTTDWMSDTVRKVLDLCTLERPNQPMGAMLDDATGPHPSLYLRLAMASMPEIESGGFLGDIAPAEVGLLRLFSPGLISQIKRILTREARDANNTTSTPSARSAASERGGGGHDQDVMRSRIAAWTALDHAVSSELGIVTSSSPQFAAGGGAAGDASSPSVNLAAPGGPTSEAAAETSAAAVRELADRAFSEIGDAREMSFLDAFAVRDNARGGGGGEAAGAPGVDWTTAAAQQEPEQGHGVGGAGEMEVDGAAALEAAGREPVEIDLAVAETIETVRHPSPARFWSECFQQLAEEGKMPRRVEHFG